MKVTLFKNISSVYTPYHIDVTEVFPRIQSGKSKKLIERIRKQKTKKERDELKKGLPSICFSGTFRERSKNKLIKHSGLICLDFDKFTNIVDVKAFKAHIVKDPFVYACFISPSALGVKAVVKIPPDPLNHKRYFNALQEHFDTPHFDTSCSDVCRVCYESYDPDIYINPDSQRFETLLELTEHEYIETKDVKVPLQEETEIIQRLDKWWTHKFGFHKGERNTNCFKLACAFSEYGITELSCIRYFERYVEKDFTRKEVNSLIRSAYMRTKHDFNTKFFEDINLIEHVHQQLGTGKSDTVIKEGLTKQGHSDSKIEVVLEEAKKHDPIDRYWVVNDKGKLAISSKRFKEYLKQHGFYKYYPEGSSHFEFVKLESNLVERTTVEKIKSFVMDALIDNSMLGIYEFFAVKPKYFKEEYLNLLEPIDINIGQDTKETGYIYFRNCAVKVSSTSIETIDYLSLDGYVWKSKVIDRDFKLSDDLTNDFSTFLYKIAGEEPKVKIAFETTIGYLLHSFKNKSYSPAVILNDEIISEHPEGGTGKGLLIYALQQLKKVSVIDGKSFDKNNQFAYQTVDPSTDLIVFDDVKKNFSFEHLFSLITEGITLERKNQNAIKLGFNQSPKVAITTNYAISGSGSSNERRRWELELAQHYSSKHTPLDEFDKLLFDDWDHKEWSGFDNYMLRCLQRFLRQGLTKAGFKNLETRKFINQTSFEFYEWSEDSETHPLIFSDRVSKNSLFEHFTTTYTDYKRWLTKKRFNSWLKHWSAHKEHPYKEGNTNGIRWIHFQKKNNEPKEEIIF